MMSTEQSVTARIAGVCDPYATQPTPFAVGTSVTSLHLASAAFMRRPPGVNDFLVEPVFQISKHHTVWLSFALDEGPRSRPGA
jgi:hypothetical protein